MQTLTKRRIDIDAERMEHYEAMSVEPGVDGGQNPRLSGTG